MGAGTNRREFMRLGTLASGLAITSRRQGAARPAAEGLRTRIDTGLASPVLRRELWPGPVRIASVDLLKAGDEFLVRVRSSDGATGLAVGHPDVLDTTWPILTRKVAPFFIGKDARDLEALIEGMYLADSNYKWQTLEVRDLRLGSGLSVRCAFRVVRAERGAIPGIQGTRNVAAGHVGYFVAVDREGCVDRAQWPGPRRDDRFVVREWSDPAHVGRLRRTLHCQKAGFAALLPSAGS